MNYENKYKQLYQLISDLYPHMSEYCKEKVEGFFPELRESEDEKIRRCIGDVVRKYGVEFATGTITKEKMLAWLEKQGEQETNMDKQETNTVKPKFKPGDWTFLEGLHPILILDIVNDKYKIEFTDNGSSGFHPIDLIDRHCRLWTIEDAKEGDVLSTNSWTFIFKYQDGGVYHHCAVSTYNDLEISDTSEFHQEYVHPATKEQRDLLFQRLKKMGYKWDAEKKELIGENE